MSYRILLYFIFPVLFLASCQKERTPEELTITAIELLAEDNSDILSKNFLIEKEGNNFRLTLPQALKGNTLTFHVHHNGSSLSVNGQKFVTSKIAVVLAEKLDFNIADETGRTKPISLSISYTTQQNITATDFILTKALNPSLQNDILLQESNGVLSASIPKSINKELVLSFTTNALTVLVNNQPQKSGETRNDFTNELTYIFIHENGVKKELILNIHWIEADIPHITIVTQNNTEITSKSTYLQATIAIAGHGLYSDFTGTTEIRGRGNSTWSYPKKPYRLKLSAKAEILGLPKAKNWVLLANYIDPSLMCNAVAMKIGHDLEVPFTNTIIPVDLTINGNYRGSYVLTEQVEVDENRVNIGEEGWLLELDSYYDEDYKFKSLSYNLPVMVKEPELQHESEIIPIKAAFEAMESLIISTGFPNNNYADHLDIPVLTKYLLVYFLTGNEEMNHPKSIYLHKKASGKFTFGPLWDFDWAYGYEAGGNHFSNPNRPQFWSSSHVGRNFFFRILESPEVRTEFKKNWQDYKTNNLSKLYTYIDEYAARIKASQARDFAKWNKGADFDGEVNKMKIYLQNRASYIDNYVQSF